MGEKQTSDLADVIQKPVSRRQMLINVARTGVAMSVGGALLAACDTSNGKVDVTLRITNDVADDNIYLVSAADQAKDPSLKAYADALQNWLSQNPGVKFTTIQAPKDDMALSALIVGNVAPSNYDDGLGNDGIAKGFYADVTDLYNKYKTESLLEPYTIAAYKNNIYNNRYFSLPDFFDPGPIVFYRKDLLQQAGLPEPNLGWTWETLRQYALTLTKGKVQGISMAYYGLGYALNSEYFDFFTRLPDPSNAYHQRWDLSYRYDDTYKPIIDNYRAMTNVDKSIYSGVGYDFQQVNTAFTSGAVAMDFAFEGFYYLPPTLFFSPQAIAKKLGKDVTEVVGGVALPFGADGCYGGSLGESQSSAQGRGFDPHLNKTALDKIYSCVQYMLMGDGFVYQRKAAWDNSHDLKQVYVKSLHFSKNGNAVPGVPGTPADAWGSYYQSVKAMASLPTVPTRAAYFPGDKTAAPSQQAWNDCLTGLAFTTDDASGLFQKAQSTLNAETSSTQSSVPHDQFVAAATKYYAAVDQFWSQQTNAGLFYSELYHPWYTNVLQPLLTK